MLINMNDLEEFFVDVFNADPIVLKFLPSALRPIYLGYTAADLIGTEFAMRTIEAGGAGAIDLFTPEIRRYEETALVGMGGMRI
jgi:hypothetical protein